MKLIIAVALAGLVILIVNTLFAYLWDRNLSVKIGFDRDMLYEGEENILREVITNAKYLPLPILQVKFSITRTFIFEREENTSVTDLYYSLCNKKLFLFFLLPKLYSLSHILI